MYVFTNPVPRRLSLSSFCSTASPDTKADAWNEGFALAWNRMQRTNGFCRCVRVVDTPISGMSYLQYLRLDGR